MEKWFENKQLGEGPIITSRVRLARNLQNYPFSGRLDAVQAEDIVRTVQEGVFAQPDLKQAFQFIPLSLRSKNEKLALMEAHLISPALVNKKTAAGVLTNEAQTVSILLNEEDHIRIQAVFPGENIDKAWEAASFIDDTIEAQFAYAYDDTIGYLTACPTNVGTGLRASYMMHLPALEWTGQMPHMVQAISKFGVTVRGIYGEGSSAQGSIYQISNQVTLGQSEEEIILNLKNVVNLVIEQEKRMQETILGQAEAFEDKIYRSYGILQNARKMTAEEAMRLLSHVWAGYRMGLLKKPHPAESIFTMMMNVQPGRLLRLPISLPGEQQDFCRARYLRGCFLNGKPANGGE